MNRVKHCILMGVLFCVGSAFVMIKPGYSQESKKTAKTVVGRSQELVEALQRIDRLESQIVEMQSVIGALQTMVKKGDLQVPQKQIPQRDRQLRDLPPRSQLDNPDLNTEGWGADTRSSLENEMPVNRVPGADIETEGGPPASRVTLNGKSSRALYDAGYNYMIASDYASAEATFRSFLSNYPQDELSGNAQYWLGETFFARGDYRRSANEFLKGYKSYRTSQKAPDNLLKLGISLQRLGQSEAACQTYAELRSKYKSLPGHVARKIGEERGKAGC